MEFGGVTFDIIRKNPDNLYPNFCFVGITDFTIIIRGINPNYTDGTTIVLARMGIILSNGSQQIVELPYNGSGSLSYDFGIVFSTWLHASGSLYVIKIILGFVNSKGGGTTYLGVGGYDEYAYYYSKPQVNQFSVARNIENKTQMDFSIDVTASSLIVNGIGEVNFLLYKRQYKNDNNEWIDLDNDLISVNSLELLSLVSNNLPYIEEKPYNIKVIIKDLFSEIALYDTLPTSAVVMTWGKNGVGFGKIWEKGALDIAGEVYKNNQLQPTIYQKKVSDPDPEGMEDGDLLVIYNDIEEFESVNFPQNFGTGYVWGQQGEWPTLFLYWTSASSINNEIVDSFECSAFKGSGYPLFMFDGNTEWDNNYMIPIEAAPLTVILHFKGKVQFNSFTLYGWMQSHEIKNAPKSFAFFGSNDGHTWISLYDTTEFPDTYGTSASADMLNSGVFYEYLKMVWRTNQDDNAGVDGTMIAIRELTFDVSGYRYV